METCSKVLGGIDAPEPLDTRGGMGRPLPKLPPAEGGNTPGRDTDRLLVRTEIGAHCCGAPYSASSGRQIVITLLTNLLRDNSKVETSSKYVSK